MKQNNDPMGAAIADYWKNGKITKTLELLSPDFDDDEFPVETLFRELDDMPEIEQTALKLAKGKILDVGAGAGCHSLALQEMGLSSKAIDISELSVTTMKNRGVKDAEVQDFWKVSEKYDTVLMLMNGIGIIGSVRDLPRFFNHINNILEPDGQLLVDSCDICYLFETEDGALEIPVSDRYYGELDYQMRYGNISGPQFSWLYLDFETMAEAADNHGFNCELLASADDNSFLARITRKK